MQGLEGMERSVNLFQIRGQQTRPRCLFLYGLWAKNSFYIFKRLGGKGEKKTKITWKSDFSVHQQSRDFVTKKENSVDVCFLSC